jgi:hypothetical protein
MGDVRCNVAVVPAVWDTRRCSPSGDDAGEVDLFVLCSETFCPEPSTCQLRIGEQKLRPQDTFSDRGCSLERFLLHLAAIRKHRRGSPVNGKQRIGVE